MDEAIKLLGPEAIELLGYEAIRLYGHMAVNTESAVFVSKNDPRKQVMRPWGP